MSQEQDTLVLITSSASETIFSACQECPWLRLDPGCEEGTTFAAEELRGKVGINQRKK